MANTATATAQHTDEKMTNIDSRAALEAHRAALVNEGQSAGKQLVSLCSGSGCGAYGTGKVYKALMQKLTDRGLEDQVDIKLTGCHGFCEKGPIMVLHPNDYFYTQVKPEHIPDIVEKSIINDEMIEKLAFKDPVSKKRVFYEKEIPFYKLQQRLIFGNNTRIDPTNIND